MNPVTPEPKAKLIFINFTCWSCMPRSHKKIIKTRVRRHAITVYIFIGGKINTNTTPSIHSATFYLPETRKNSNRNKEVVVALRWLTNKLTTTIHRSLKQIINKLDKKNPSGVGVLSSLPTPNWARIGASRKGENYWSKSGEWILTVQ